jgi:hypothetical protein
MALAVPGDVSAQEPADKLTPLAIADSTYAVRVAVDALAEGIRRGQLDLRRFNDAQLALAVGRLATRAGASARRSPHADVGVLWDLRIELSDFQPEGRDVLRARADVLLATVPESARAPVTLTFRRRGDRWDLTAHQDLVARLTAIATALEKRGRP